MSFRADDRGVSQLIGALFIFATLIIAFSGYQAGFVPSQNADVEWNHYLQVQDELLDVRNTIITSRITGNDGFVSVKLGTEYPPRLIAVNPSSPTGTLRTTEAYPISVHSSGDNLTDDVCGVEDLEGEYYVENETRFLEYEPHYNEFREHGVLRYENSIYYHDFDHGNIIKSSQRLLRGDEVTITPLVTHFSEQSRERVTVEPTPGLLSTQRVTAPTITLPTALEQDDWASLLEPELEKRNELDTRGISDVVNVSEGELTLDLKRTYQVRCGVIGINDAPESGGRDAFPESEAKVHPAETAGIRFDGASSRNQGQDRLVVDFENLEDTDVNISRFTVNFYTGSSDPAWVEISANDDFSEGETRVMVGDTPTELDPQIILAGKAAGAEDGEVTNVHLQFDDMSPGDWFIMTVQYGTGERTQYFVGV